MLIKALESSEIQANMSHVTSLFKLCKKIVVVVEVVVVLVLVVVVKVVLYLILNLAYLTAKTKKDVAFADQMQNNR